ncbi:S1-like domain-containing RNA-binding protein [Microaerobacter geothermalis]|uniref:CvfB family protein n=1 Tax=Microaerobacter geothermalis TaxID=674972 RepID=UPI001F30C70A|nr:S1-like domain-containing RNA-binding protein [Microaerobacter geothermalis]MCF6094127.1 S1-like domain-containing RNA-binding protein [Microaerobacter geothermalis]
MEKLKAGNKVKLKVERQAPFGYFLSNGEEDVLLHQSEVVGQVKLGQLLEVFLYHDSKNRLAATMLTPKITEGEYKFLTVADVNSRLGVYVDIGIHKDLLVSKDEMPTDKEQWPRAGDILFVGISYDKQGRMLGILGKEENILPLSKEAPPSLVNKFVTGTIYHVFHLGAFLLTEDGYIAFLHRDEAEGYKVRLGEKLKARVKWVRPDGKVNLTLLPKKEERYGRDALLILQHLQSRNGMMPYSDETSPEVLRQKFNLSKAAFKRALGKLLKEGKVYQKDGWTYLKQDQ